MKNQTSKQKRRDYAVLVDVRPMGTPANKTYAPVVVSEEGHSSVGNPSDLLQIVDGEETNYASALLHAKFSYSLVHAKKIAAEWHGEIVPIVESVEDWMSQLVSVKKKSNPASFKTKKRVVFHFGQETKIPQEWIDSVPRSGPADDAVDYLARKYDVQVSEGDLKKYLKEYGAWDADELSDHYANIERLIWLASLECQENDTNYFYMGI